MVFATSATAILAASFTPILGASGCILWENSWLGSPFALNLFKSVFAGLLFFIVACIFRWPLWMLGSLNDVKWVAIASLLSNVVGDSIWLSALKMIGARRVIMIDATKPLIGSLLGAIFLNQPFSLYMIVGIGLSSCGLLLASLDRKPSLHKKEYSGSVHGENGNGRLDILEALKSEHDLGHLSAMRIREVRNLDVFNETDSKLSADPGINAWEEDNNEPNERSSLSGMHAGLSRISQRSKPHGTRDKHSKHARPVTVSRGQHSMHNIGLLAEITTDDMIDIEESNGLIDKKTLALGYAYAVLNTLLDCIGSVLIVHHGIQMTPFEIGAIQKIVCALCLFAVAGAYLFIRGVGRFCRWDRVFFMWNSSNNYQTTSTSLPGLMGVDGGTSMLGTDISGSGSSIELESNNSSIKNTVPFVSNPLVDQSIKNKFSKIQGARLGDEDSVRSESILGTNGPIEDPNEDQSDMEDGERQSSALTDRDDESNADVDMGSLMEFNSHSAVQSNKWYAMPYMPQENWNMVMLGTLFVTFLTPILYIYALFKISVGLCLTLSSLGPIYAVPLLYCMKGEETSVTTALGSLLAVVGVIILCMG